MALDETSRLKVWVRGMKEKVVPGNLSKTEFRAAVNAADDWVDSSQSAFNAALPVEFKTSATVTQKAALLALILIERYSLL